MKTRLDSDKVEIVTIEEAKRCHPDLDWDYVYNRFAWDILEDDVMAVDDLEFCIEMTKRGCLTEHTMEEYLEKEQCSVCGVYLLIDDEAYVDVNTGEVLCDNHSIFDDELNGYVKAL